MKRIIDLYWNKYPEWILQNDRFEIMSIILMTITALAFIFIPIRQEARMKGESMISYKKEAYSISIPEGELEEWEIRRIVANLPLSVREFIINKRGKKMKCKICQKETDDAHDFCGECDKEVTAQAKEEDVIKDSFVDMGTERE